MALPETSDVPLQVFEIYLHREEYFPGEIITGKLLIMADQIIKTEGIYLKFQGKAVLKWKKRPAYLCGLQEAEYVQGEKKCFVNVFRYEQEQLPEGSSAFPFEFELPTGIPPSKTRLKHVKICYLVEALIRTSNEDYRQTKQFTVNGLLNLNAFPELSLSICKSVREIVNESCLSSGQRVNLSFTIKKQGFVPGEVLTAEMSIKECDCLELVVPALELQLIQEMEIKVDQNSRLRRKIVKKNHILQASSVDGQTQNVTFVLKIPDDTLISFENHCQDLIHICYSLRVSMEKSVLPYRTIQLTIPIKIGSVWIKAHTGPPPPILSPVPRKPTQTTSPLKHEDNKDHKDNDQHHGSSNPSSDQALPSEPPEILINSADEDHSAKWHPQSTLTEGSNYSPNKAKTVYSVISNLARGTNSVIDSSSFLTKPQEAFGGVDTTSRLSEE